MVSGPVQKRGRSPARQNERPSWGGSRKGGIGGAATTTAPPARRGEPERNAGPSGGMLAGRVRVRGDQPSRVGCIDLPGVRKSWNRSEDATWRSPWRAQRDGMCERPPAWLRRPRRAKPPVPNTARPERKGLRCGPLHPRLPATGQLSPHEGRTGGRLHPA